eukprot:TRINITY_DN13328_c1_g1_i1.p1 TRINITY_DN13328_c1_g1~~TRINITY_DN13328_c1_g1_i1.p1  ORF type:complete len:546 (-),score=151.27 TRINITY_DN13328_c1_g1_i1:275-1912(-)
MLASTSFVAVPASSVAPVSTSGLLGGCRPGKTAVTKDGNSAVAAGFAGAALLAAAASSKRKRGTRRNAQTGFPVVDRATTKQFRRELTKSDSYFKFGRTQMEGAMDELRKVSGSNLLTKIRENGFQLTVGDITFVLAESYGFCWGVERAVAMAYEARNHFPEKSIFVTNEIIHNPSVNENLGAMGMKFIQARPDGSKDYSDVKKGDVVVLPAFGASIDEMALLKEREVQIVDTTCPWVSKVWGSVEKSKDKGATSIIHGKYDHEETVATKSFAQTYLVLKDMAQAEFVSQYILGNVSKEDFLKMFSKEAMSEGFDPDEDLKFVGVANQTTMLKGETELIGKLFERTMIKKYGPQNINDHFMSFNTICDATQERQDAMYKLFGAKYEAPESALYAELEGEQVGVELMSSKLAEKLSSKQKEDESRGSAVAADQLPSKVDVCIVLGGFNSSNTTHLLEIAEEEGVPAYHIDCGDRIGVAGGEATNKIQHKPLSTKPAQAMLDEGLEVKDSFLPDGPLTIGITSGASTPDKMVGDALERILAIRGLSA